MTLAFLPMLAPLALFSATFLAFRSPGSRPGRVLRMAEVAAMGAIAVSLLSCLTLLMAGPSTSPLFGLAGLGLAVRLDVLSVTLLLLVSFIGWVVIRFASTYMDGELRQGAFTGWLCATLAAVLLLVTAGNLLQLVLAWVATSVFLHRLLLHYPERVAAQRAARKKFLFARVGDAALGLAAVLLYADYGTGDIAQILAAAQTGAGQQAGLWAAALLALAAVLKSAQFPAHGWLTEVMETPTPVSALLHAGVVNAGGFLLIRFADVMLLAPGALAVLVIVGGFSALLGGLVMLTQPAVKTSLAWSTVAQMGFMMLQCGLALFSLALLHIVAHSLYKAHAFLTSGMAVDTVASIRRPGPVAIPDSRAVGRAFLIAVTIYVLTGLLFGFSGKSPQAIALGAILIFGVAYLLAQGLAGAAPRALTQRTAVYSIAATMGYFTLHSASEWLMSGTLPATPSPGPLEWALIVLSLLSFALVAVAQSMFPLWAYHPAAAGLRVHLSNGLYANAVLNRLLDGWSVDRQTDTRLDSAEVTARPASGVVGEAINSTTTVGQPALTVAADRAARAIPPAWPLASSVAVNPFYGQSADSLTRTGARLARVSGVSITMPRTWYASRMADGRIRDEDLAWALAHSAEAQRPDDVEALKRAVDVSPEACMPPTLAKPLPTVADLAARVSGIDWPSLLAERIGSWAGGYFDEGQALWAASHHRAAYADWRQFAAHDLTPEIAGLHGFAQFIVDAPADADQAIARSSVCLGLDNAALDTYFHQLLLSQGGWAQYARYRLWRAELAGQTDGTITDLLSIRLLWEEALYRHYEHLIAGQWQAVKQGHAEDLASSEPAFVIDTLLQEAAERAAHREIGVCLEAPVNNPVETTPVMQVAFCIDVRSEVFRRALESVDPRIRTLGFAGFFGLPTAYRAFASDTVERRLPVLLNPGMESAAGEQAGAGAAEADYRARLQARASRAWGRFKLAAVSSFAFVEAVGPVYLGKLLRDSLHLLPTAVRKEPAPEFEPALGIEARIKTAETVLRAMSLTSHFSGLVVLAGHGASVVNNPFSSGLQCGACGGYSGEVNARLLAALLNDQAVRAGLARQGIDIPDQTRFIGALHDTTTDKVRLYSEDLEETQSSSRVDDADIRQAEDWLGRAGLLVRAERALRLPGAASDRDIILRSQDWAEVRPEWALAGCQAFIAAPRARTSGRDLSGRYFLHDYDWTQDAGFGVLELIMTAPVVVASWISLQYYGSTVAPGLFGAGNKLLHNVVGGIGVLEGNGGVLRAGLPWQSVHDGDTYSHEPLRLAVCIEAPREAMNDILGRHAHVRELFDNRWLHLFAMDENGQISWQYAGNLEWMSSQLQASPGQRAAECAA